MSRKQKALYNFLLDKLKEHQEILIVGLDNKDEKYTPTLNVINGDKFLSLNQNGLAICNVYPEDELYEYEVVTFYDTSDAQENGEGLVYQISRHTSGQSTDELGSSTWFTISQEGKLVQTDQQLSLFQSRKPIKSSVDNDRVYSYSFDYIITKGDTVNDVENRILNEIQLIDGIEVVGNPGINNTSWSKEEYGITSSFQSRKPIKSSISAAALEEQLDGQFWTRVKDFEDEVNEAGWDIEDVNDEYVTISNDKGSQYEVRFYDHGEGRSFTMESFKCIYCDEDDDDYEIESSNQLNRDKAFLRHNLKSSRKPIKSSIYISDIIDNISDDCFGEIHQQISEKYPDIDDDVLTEKINEYLDSWRYDSDSEADNEEQAKRMIVDCWEDYIDLSDFDDSTSSLDKLDIRAINFYAGEILKDVKNGKFPATMDGVREWVNLFNQREGVYFNPLYIKPIFEKLKRLLSLDVIKSSRKPIKSSFDDEFEDSYCTARRNIVNINRIFR